MGRSQATVISIVSEKPVSKSGCGFFVVYFYAFKRWKEARLGNLASGGRIWICDLAFDDWWIGQVSASVSKSSYSSDSTIVKVWLIEMSRNSCVVPLCQTMLTFSIP